MSKDAKIKISIVVIENEISESNNKFEKESRLLQLENFTNLSF
jgi:hypothetical protein